MSTFSDYIFLVLAPVSLISEFLLLYGFLRLKELRAHPEILIFWECIAQIIFDAHWFTGISFIKIHVSDFACQFLGSLCVYFYILSWDYNVLLSIEILLKILNPHRTGYVRRRFWYHSISHLTSLAIFIALMVGENNGNSVLNTCFVESRTVYELVILIPAIVHFPVCIGITAYTFWLSHNTFYVPYLKYHMVVVCVFAGCWLPPSLLHGLNYRGFGVQVPEWLAVVNDR